MSSRPFDQPIPTHHQTDFVGSTSTPHTATGTASNNMAETASNVAGNMAGTASNLAGTASNMAAGTASNVAETVKPNVEALKNSELPQHPILPSRRTPTDHICPDAAAAYNTVANGPVAQNVMDQSAKTSAELSNLASARQTPPYKAATGQNLTHYHSFFLELLSWNNPRASAIAYASIVSLIFSVRYLDIMRWGFKLTWMILGITLAAELAGKALLNNGFATQIRPRKYYTVSRETLDAMIGDVHELVNFFVIEAQRVLFAENVYVSAAAAVSAFIAYYLVKIVPYWGLAVIAATVLFFVPLIYTTNREVIDHQLHHASEVVGAQTAQLRTVAQKNTEKATQATKQYMGDYTAKAQALINNAVPRRSSSGTEHHDTAVHDLPTPPKEDFTFRAPEKADVQFPAVPKQDAQFPAVPAVPKVDVQYPAVPKEEFKLDEATVPVVVKPELPLI